MATTDNQTIANTLRRVLALFNNGRNWTQGSWARTDSIDEPENLLTCDPAQTCFCLQGALGYVTGHDPATTPPHNHLYSVIDCLLDEELGTWVTDWNDEEGRKYWHVERVLLDLIAKLERPTSNPTFPGWGEVDTSTDDIE